MILETERLYLREMEQADFEALCKILQDEDTCTHMRAHLITLKSTNGLTDKLHAIRNGALVYGLLS